MRFTGPWLASVRPIRLHALNPTQFLFVLSVIYYTLYNIKYIICRQACCRVSCGFGRASALYDKRNPIKTMSFLESEQKVIKITRFSNNLDEANIRSSDCLETNFEVWAYIRNSWPLGSLYILLNSKSCFNSRANS